MEKNLENLMKMMEEAQTERAQTRKLIETKVGRMEEKVDAFGEAPGLKSREARRRPHLPAVEDGHHGEEAGGPKEHGKGGGVAHDKFQKPETIQNLIP